MLDTECRSSQVFFFEKSLEWFIHAVSGETGQGRKRRKVKPPFQHSCNCYQSSGLTVISRL